MSKLVLFFLLLTIGMGIWAGVYQGGGGYIVTETTSDISDTDIVVPVDDTTEFLDSLSGNDDYLTIGEEKIIYTGKTANSFTGCTRGYSGTEAVTHLSGAYVYTATSSAGNSAMGFDVAAIADSMGVWSTIAIPIMFLVITVPHTFVLCAKLFSGDGALIGAMFYAFFAAFAITFAIALAGGRRVS